MVEAAAGQVRHEVAAVIEQLGSLVVRRLSPRRNLSLTTMSVLARLAVQGAARVSELASQEGVTQPAMTQLVSRLERHGLAERRGEIDDGRVVNVHITRRGRELLKQRRAERTVRLAELMGHLPPEDQSALAAAAPALRRLVSLGEVEPFVGAVSAIHRDPVGR